MTFLDERAVTDRNAVIAAVDKNPLSDEFGDDRGEELIQMGSQDFESESQNSAPDAPAHDASAADATTSAGDDSPSPPPAADYADYHQLKDKLAYLEREVTESKRQAQRQAEQPQHQPQYQQPDYSQYENLDPRVVAAHAYEAAQAAHRELITQRTENAVLQMKRGFLAAEREFLSKNPDLDKHVNPDLRKMSMSGMEAAIRAGRIADPTQIDYSALLDNQYSRSKRQELQSELEQLKSTKKQDEAQVRELSKVRGIPQGGAYQQPAPSPKEEKAKSKIGSSDYRNTILSRARALFAG